jgi:hypothetical protein
MSSPGFVNLQRTLGPLFGDPSRSPDPLSVDSAVRKTCSRSSEVLGEQVQVKVGATWLRGATAPVCYNV